jgi:thioredoxin-related protein
MKLSKAVLLLVILALGTSSSFGASEKIDWHTYEGGMARSKFEKKKVLLYFFAEWCTYCAQMERQTFKNPTVIATLNRNFIPIRVDSDRDTATASLFRVQGLPFSVFLSDNGEKIAHVPGFIPPEQMMKILHMLMSGGGGN